MDMDILQYNENSASINSDLLLDFLSLHIMPWRAALFSRGWGLFCKYVSLLTNLNSDSTLNFLSFQGAQLAAFHRTGKPGELQSMGCKSWTRLTDWATATTVDSQEASCVRSHFSPVWTFATPWRLSSWDSPGKDTGVACHFFLQGFFLHQGSNPPRLLLLLGRWILCP